MEDNRKISGGWKLTVAQNGQLSTANKEEPIGAEIIFKGLKQLRNEIFAPNLAEEQVLSIDGSAVLVADAVAGDGVGSWSIAFGNESSAKTAIKLTVPDESKKIKDIKYSTMLI